MLMKNDASCFSCALTGADSKWVASPNAARPCRHLHWATIVAHLRALAAFAAPAPFSLLSSTESAH